MLLKRTVFILSLLAFFSFEVNCLLAGTNQGLSEGQSVYVPAYTHIYVGNQGKPFLLTVTLSIRNIDPEYPIVITRVDYYETQGTLVKEYLDKPVTLKPLESLRYVIPEKEEAGGSGANFIVNWKADSPVNPPIVESVNIGTRTQQGISFTSRGTVIQSK